MSTTQSPEPTRAPRHLWVVGILILLWNAMGAFDYVMTQTHNDAYMSNFTPEQLEYYNNFPVWMVSSWAIAVWAGVLGAVLLLLRKSWAVSVFLVALVAFLVSTLYSYVFSNGLEVVGDTFSLVFTAVIFLVSVAQYWYASRLRKRRVLG